jgi:hypothetical protein
MPQQRNEAPLNETPASHGTALQFLPDGAAYFRAAQAYMLISMPTGISTIFGVFQAIVLSFPNPSGRRPTMAEKLTCTVRFVMRKVVRTAGTIP